MAKEKTNVNANGIYDARKLGIPKMLLLGFQHMFAMFGATVLVPLLTGLDVATTLLMAGLGTLLFHIIAKGKVPAFLGSSFAFLGGYAAVAPMENGLPNTEKLPYACLGVACAGLVYLILATLIKLVGINKVMRFFPPVVTGPIIIAIGLGLAGSAVNNCKTNWLLAIVALALVIIFNVWGKGMAKIIPILIGVVGSCAVAAILALTTREYVTVLDESGKIASEFYAVNGIEQLKLFDVSAWAEFKNAAWIGLPVHKSETIFAIDWSNKSLIISSIVAIVPISLATMMEHIGDISAIGATCGRNYIKDPGLHRTLIGDGLATSLSAVFGGPANTTYGENTGVLALSRVYDPRVIRLAAVFAVILSFSPKFAAFINLIPPGIIGGISFVLYGMISAIGVRNVVENKVDFKKSRNLIVAAIILVTALGLGSLDFKIGGVDISLSALAVASIVGIVLNAILPGKDYNFDESGYENGKDSEDTRTPKTAEASEN
ncbi:MAG: uracil-xanthine permease family protein [Oscillospiraceae bacterium]|nr:uracil-xanthine permease family protein [Ruminococcus sp.]MDD7338659.1 uracil-xanthine permease family protein [Ruminococcus sp.]MDY6061281.1 uracil-xanthine permease family protein [Oscillospiraceae bacterium]